MKAPRRRRGAADPWGPVRRRGLRAWSMDHYRVAADSLRYVSERLGTSLLVWLLIGIALALPGGLYLLQVNLGEMIADWEGRPGLSVYFEREADIARAETLRDGLSDDARVRGITLISAEQALEEFREFAGLSDALAVLETNPLPVSLRIIVADGVTATDMDELAAALRAAPGVDEVSIERSWLERVQAMTAAVRRLGLMLAALFALGAVLVTATSVRLAIEASLDEVKVMKLVGATDAYIRRPFLYFGLFYGLGGALVGAMLISTLLLVLETPLARLLGSYGETIEVAGLTPLFFVQVLGLGGGLGVGGALLAARQRLANLEVI